MSKAKKKDKSKQNQQLKPLRRPRFSRPVLATGQVAQKRLRRPGTFSQSSGSCQKKKKHNPLRPRNLSLNQRKNLRRPRIMRLKTKKSPVEGLCVPPKSTWEFGSCLHFGIQLPLGSPTRPERRLLPQETATYF